MIAQGGLQKLIDGGVFTLERQQSSAFVPNPDRQLNKVQTKRSPHGGGGNGGGS
jgi:hypothetical protein